MGDYVHEVIGCDPYRELGCSYEQSEAAVKEYHKLRLMSEKQFLQETDCEVPCERIQYDLESSTSK